MAGGWRRRSLAGALGGAAALAVGVPLAVAAAEAPSAVERAVPVVLARSCGQERQGSGVVVEHAGVPRLLTDAHVVEGARTVGVGGVDAPVVGHVGGLDAAVVMAPAGIDALLTGPPPRAGDAVVVVGHPGGRAATREGHVVARTRRTARGGAADVVLLDVAVRPGDSGGAVLDRSGRVVALVAARDERTGGAVAYPVRAVLGGEVAPAPAGC